MTRGDLPLPPRTPAERMAIMPAPSTGVLRGARFVLRAAAMIAGAHRRRTLSPAWNAPPTYATARCDKRSRPRATAMTLVAELAAGVSTISCAT